MNKLDIHSINQIMQFIPDNFSSINLANTCKEFHSYFNKAGCLKTIPLHHDTKHDVFYVTSRKHKKSVVRFTLHNITNPLAYIPYWPKQILLFQCKSQGQNESPKGCEIISYQVCA